MNRTTSVPKSVLRYDVDKGQYYLTHQNLYVLVLASFQGRRKKTVRFLYNLHWEDWQESFSALCFTAWTSNIVEWMFPLWVHFESNTYCCFSFKYRRNWWHLWTKTDLYLALNGLAFYLYPAMLDIEDNASNGFALGRRGMQSIPKTVNSAKRRKHR